VAFGQGVEIPGVFDEPVKIGKFIVKLAVIINVTEHAGIDVHLVIQNLFQEGFALRGNIVVFLDVVVSRDDEEVFDGTTGGSQNGVYFFINGMVLVFLARLGDVAGEADGMDIGVVLLGAPFLYIIEEFMKYAGNSGVFFKGIMDIGDMKNMEGFGGEGLNGDGLLFLFLG